ncbi:hypothetical protein EJ074_20490 [Mesorhizobium sp. M3A.F.Ca.ET.080.04.2.1]|uniref:hypothetical protein n=1 Tax=Mesorhizobium sp. M3A.F.Ca.ET.080.04.2.1 TaxID=2493676 RepID=UPI000F765B13|nr:hypothetical protein [Mesorhizobium sp. M3A.F.Ca.ET.080.04.2.1]AZO11201.1 hypothetical protein EJ074_20490 [Mesorhizobium sp. M3A.F.Ca.ET.080.04.2.1]RWF23788.1 MAG: hypothetical protein EOS64_10080 [Mesorhizobium sp.]
MADQDDAVAKFIQLAFKANGAALTLSVVAASNLLKGSAVPAMVTVVPSWLFLIGLVLAYALMTTNALSTTHFGNLHTLLQIRETIMNIEFAEHRTEETEKILADSIESKRAIEASLLSKKQLAEMIRATNWLMNGSMVCFAAGVIWALIAISIEQHLPVNP